ncbi:MAG: DUF4149 domain-containing protein [Sideroxydans sp.]|nr:DUF4149 domain-containing protein [Sideroxydans sp.]
MKNIPHYLAALAITVWVGGLWVIGYLAVPTLFYGQADRQLAGMLAGQMFETLGYIGILCGGFLLTQRYLLTAKTALRDLKFLLIAAMLLITLVMQFYIQPLMADLKIQALPLDVMQSAFAQSFKLWHGISSVLYLVESLLGAMLVIRTFRTPSQ